MPTGQYDKDPAASKSSGKSEHLFMKDNFIINKQNGVIFLQTFDSSKA